MIRKTMLETVEMTYQRLSWLNIKQTQVVVHRSHLWLMAKLLYGGQDNILMRIVRHLHVLYSNGKHVH